MEHYVVNSYGEKSLESSFMVEFHDGYSFKNLVDFLKRINNIATFQFKEKGIEVVHCDPQAENIATRFLVKRQNLYRYEVNSPSGSLELGMNLRDLQKLIKSTGKKDGLIMYKKKGECTIMIQLAGSNRSSQQNVSVFRPCNNEGPKVELPVYETEVSQPSAVVLASSISSTFNALNLMKKSTLLVRMRVNGQELTIDNLIEDTTSGRVDTFPMRRYEGVPLPNYEANVKVATLKCLVKLNNLNPNGLLKVYLENDKDNLPNPIKISGKVSSWGKIDIYLSPFLYQKAE